MNKNSQEGSTTASAFIQLLGVLLRLIGIYLIGFAILAAIFQLFIGVDLQELDATINTLDSDDARQDLLLLVQTIAPLIQFILLPVLYILFYQKSLKEDVFKVKSWRPATFFILGILLYFTFLPVLQYLIKWNQTWNLPDAWSQLEQQLYNMEERAKEITTVLIQYDSNIEFLKILFVVAVLPAVGEELFFRGLMQNEIRKVTGSAHFAIWFTAIAFSFVHFQFFGFVPRMVLGLVFGYLYFWSGNILIPMGLHFLNNASTLVLMNAFKEQYEQMEEQPVEDISILGIIFSLMLTTALVYYCHKLYKERKALNAE